MPKYLYMCSITIDADSEKDASALFNEQTKDMDIFVLETEVEEDE